MEEEHAAKVVQRSLRHHLSHSREQSMVAGTESYRQTLQELQHSIPLIEPSVEELGAIVLRLIILIHCIHTWQNLVFSQFCDIK